MSTASAGDVVHRAAAELRQSAVLRQRQHRRRAATSRTWCVRAHRARTSTASSSVPGRGWTSSGSAMRRRDTVIISTPFDAYRAVRKAACISRLPISRIVPHRRILECFHLERLRRRRPRGSMLKSRYRCYPILDENDQRRRHALPLPPDPPAAASASCSSTTTRRPQSVARPRAGGDSGDHRPPPPCRHPDGHSPSISATSRSAARRPSYAAMYQEHGRNALAGNGSQA